MNVGTGDRSMQCSRHPRIRTEEEVEAEQAAAWRAWWKKLTPDEKVQLENLELTAPTAPKPRKLPRRSDDDEVSTLGTCEHIAADYLDPSEALMAKEDAEAADRAGSCASARTTADPHESRRELMLLGYVLAAIIDAADPRLEASIIALALGIGARQGITREALAKRHGVPWNTISARTRTWEFGFGVCQASLGLPRVVIAPILSSRNPRLEAETIALATRFGLSGGASMTERGAFHGVCKAAISARVRRWVKRLGIPLPRDCKTKTSNYLLYNVRREKSKPITE